MSDADARRDAAIAQFLRGMGGANLTRIVELCEELWAAATADRADYGRAEFERALAAVWAEATPSRWGWGGTRENVERVRKAEQVRRRESGEGE